MKLKKIGILIMTLALSLGSATIYASNEESNLMEESVKDDNNQVTMEGQTLGLAEVENARQLGGYYTEDLCGEGVRIHSQIGTTSIVLSWTWMVRFSSRVIIIIRLRYRNTSACFLFCM